METGPEEIGPDNAKAAKKTEGHLQHQAAALKAWEAGSNTDKDGKTAKDQAGQQPLIVLSAPAGIASLSQQSQTVAPALTWTWWRSATLIKPPAGAGCTM